MMAEPGDALWVKIWTGDLQTDLQKRLLTVCGSDRVLKQAQEIAVELCYPYIPENTGKLIDSVKPTPKGATWKTDYAHYVYAGKVYGPNFRKTDKETGEEVWRSPKGKGSKHPTGRPMKYNYWQVDAKNFTGPTKPLAGPNWVERMLAHDRRRMNLRITAMLKKEIE